MNEKCVCGHTVLAHDGPCLVQICECRTYTPTSPTLGETT